MKMRSTSTPGRRAAAAAAALLLACASLPIAAQQMYRWVDKDGRVSYSDKPPPPKDAKDLQRRNVSASVIDTSGLDYPTQQAVKNFPVTLFTSPDCKDICAQARDLLAKRGVPFSEVSVSDEASRNQLKQASGDTQVPVLMVGRDMTKGWEQGAYHGALDAAGYPKSGQAGRGALQAKAAPKSGTPAAPAPKPDRPAGKYNPE